MPDVPQPKSRLGQRLADKGKNVTDKLDKPTIPWGGPDGPGPNGGVTQGMIGRFLICRERFKVRVHQGLGPKESFSPMMEYGNLWHAAEEAFKTNPNRSLTWLTAILDYHNKLRDKYPMDREAITHWYGLCREQFPIYIEYWNNEDAEQNRIRLLSEQTFDVPYKLPFSDRTVRLRGKWDGVSLINNELWLDENKTKSQVEQARITRQLKFDLQTMLYIIALIEKQKDGSLSKLDMIGNGSPILIKGVRYNVVKRSAHKSPESMVKKIREDIDAGRGGEWFGRWNVPISQHDIDKFKSTCLDPVLEQMCLWWDNLTKDKTRDSDNDAMDELSSYQKTDTYRFPYGVWNPIEHGEDVVDEYLNTGSTIGLQRITNLFPELQD